MSILPSRDQEPSSRSPPAPSSPPSSTSHGLRPGRSPSPSFPDLQFGSLHIHDSGSVAPAAEDSGGSSEKVIELETPNGVEETLPCQNSSDALPDGEVVSSAQPTGRMPGHTPSPRSRQGNIHSGGRRTQMMNGNHLLNFQYDPISRPQSRAPPPPRRQQKRKPYNRDLFLQANFKFVVLDTGDYTPESMDPDKMLQWDDIVCVRYSTPFPVQCPICLEYPLCPQITSCGHIFCFPCILRYLYGDEDCDSVCFRRCPLCFVMISAKDLYTIYIENVKQYSVGDTAEFILLTRQKDSFNLFPKNRREKDMMPCCGDECYDRFAKFALTSDVDLSVREAISDLDGWLARADSGIVDDLEKLPYVCAAMKQLKQRSKYWNEHRAQERKKSSKYLDSQRGAHVFSSTGNAPNVDAGSCSIHPKKPSVVISRKNKHLVGLKQDKSEGGTCLDQKTDLDDLEGQEPVLSSSYEEGKSLQSYLNGCRDTGSKDSYNFYQVADGQHIILHPLNVKCLLSHYGSYEMFPHRVSGRILQLETVTQTEAMRKRYRYLSHFSLTTTFQLCEIDLSEILPPEAISPFMDEIKKREKLRKQQAKKERKEKIKAEAASVHYLPVLSSVGQSSHDAPTFSMDDFEALGTSPLMSSSPPVIGERKLFSSVTKLGFAAGYDSPALKVETNSRPSSETTSDPPAVAGSRNVGSQSFANVISREKSAENLGEAKSNEIGKKGKKHSRVLMSTAGGRRY